MSVVLHEQPQNNNLSFSSGYASMCGTGGNVSLLYSVQTPGLYSGEVILDAPGFCREIALPFSFYVQESEDIPTVVAEYFQWSGLFDDGLSCPITTATGNTSAGFYSSVHANDYEQFGLNNGVEITMLSEPDSSDFEVLSVFAEVTNYGEGSIYSLEYLVSTVGIYNGYLTIFIPGGCQGISIPFMFEIAATDALGICGGGCEDDLDGDGICDNIDTCVDLDDNDCGSVNPEWCGFGTFFDTALGACLPEVSCPGDINLSMTVDIHDLLVLLSVFGDACVMACEDYGDSELCANSNSICGPGTYLDPETALCIPSTPCRADLDDDGLIGMGDLLEYLSLFGVSCE